MRYINKEYGFTFRPPFFNKFYEEKPTGAPLSSDNFPKKYFQGVGLDYSAVNGAMLVGKNGSLWGIKVTYFSGSRWLESKDFLLKMNLSSANTLDGSFAHFASGPLSVKWVKHNEQSMMVEISARKKLKVRVSFYPCYDWYGELSIEGSDVKGRSPYVGIIPGKVGIGDNNAIYKDRFQVVGDMADEKEYFMAKSYNRPSSTSNGNYNEAIMEFVINNNQPSIYIYATVGGEDIFEIETPRIDKIIKQIETSQLRYGVNKTRGTGLLGESVERMFNAVMWSKIYYPYLLTDIYSPQRYLLDEHFNLTGIDENCAAILGSSVGSNHTAINQLQFTIEDKILSVFSLWYISARCSDKKVISSLYKKLLSLYPREAQLVISDDTDKTQVAYKQDDSPLKEKYNTARMYSLDLSCAKLLAFDILHRISAKYAFPEQDEWEKVRKDMICLINETFWHDKEGLYINRYATGQWANNFGATSFYPLICGAVDSEDKLSMLINNLTNPDRFWGEFGVPSLSMDNQQYGKRGKPNNNGHRNPPYMNYRGSIVPYINFIIYYGLCRYGLDELATKLAQKCARLWQNNSTDNIINQSMFLPNGKKFKSRKYLSSNGNMLPLIALNELIDLECFRGDLSTDALRFGSFLEGENSITNYKLLDKSYSLVVNDDKTILLCNNSPLFVGEGGKFIVRNFIIEDDIVEFMIDAHAYINISLSITDSQNSRKKNKYFLIVPSGRSLVHIESDITINGIRYEYK